MAIMLGALYDALRQAAIPEDAARKAAEEVAGTSRGSRPSRAGSCC